MRAPVAPVAGCCCCCSSFFVRRPALRTRSRCRLSVRQSARLLPLCLRLCGGCQYEMMLDEARAEPAAFICRFPEELDRRMWGSR